MDKVLMVAFTGVIALATLAYFVISVCLWRAARRSSDAARESAKAAKLSAMAALLNAQAVINAERPWLLVTVQPDPEGGFFYRVTNKGRTPATITSGYREMEFVVGNPGYITKSPSYSSPMCDPPSGMLVAGEEWNDHPSFRPELVIDRDGKREAVRSCTEFLCFYGQVTYRDALGEPGSKISEHYTRWFYQYDVFQKRLVMGGPPEYRQKT